MIDLTKWAVARQKANRCTDTETTVAADEVVVGRTDGGKPVIWPRPTLEKAGHAVVFAASGAGKSIMVGSATVQELARTMDCPQATVVIDAKGDLVEAVLEGICATCPERLSDVFYLDPFSTGGFPFNLLRLRRTRTPVDIFALQLAQMAAEVSTSVGAQAHLGAGARQMDVLTNVILAALTSPLPGATVLWALDALTTPNGLRRLALVTTSVRARQFLLSAQLSDELRSSCASRLRSSLAASDALERLVCDDDCIQLDTQLSPGRIVLVHLGAPVGGLTSLQAFYANLLARLIIDHLMERESPWRGHACRIVIDEAQIVAPVLADRAEVVLTTGRSRGISLTVMSQGTTLIKSASDTLLRVLMTNSPSRFIGRLGAPDAELLAKEQAPARGVDDSLAAVRGRFTATVTNLQDREWFRLTPGSRDRFISAEVDVAGWRRAAELHADELIAVRERLALRAAMRPRTTLIEIVPDEALRNGSRRGSRSSRSNRGPGGGSSPRPPTRWGGP